MKALKKSLLVVVLFIMITIVFTGCLTLLFGESFFEYGEGYVPPDQSESASEGEYYKDSSDSQTSTAAEVNKPAITPVEQTEPAQPTQPAQTVVQSQPQATGQQAETQVEQSVQPSETEPEPSTDSEVATVYDRSINGKELFGYYISMNSIHPLVYFRAIGNHRIVYATYDLEKMQWTNINETFDRSKVDLTKLYITVGKTAAELDVLSPELAAKPAAAQSTQSNQPSSSVSAAGAEKPEKQVSGGTSVNDEGDIVNTAVDDKDLWGYRVRLYSNNTRAHFFETRHHTIASAVYDLVNQCWLSGRDRMHASGMDLTDLYTRVSKSHEQLDRLYEAPAEVVEEQTIRNNIYLPVIYKLAPNSSFELVAGVGEVGKDWTVKLHISATESQAARTVTFPPSNNVRRTASFSTNGYSRGEDVLYYFEVMAPGKTNPYVFGIKGGVPALSFKIVNNGKPEEQPYIYKFEDPEPVVSEYLDLPQITAPVSGENNELKVDIKNSEASNWNVSFGFSDAGANNYKGVKLNKRGNSFLGSFQPKQYAGEEIEYYFGVVIPGSRGGSFTVHGTAPVRLVKSGQRSYTASEVLSMMEIPPIRDYPTTSHDQYNPQYNDWSGSKPIIVMSQEIKKWSLQVYYRKKGSGDDWTPAYSSRAEFEKDYSRHYDNDDHKRNGERSYYNISLPANTYWAGDVIEYYFNVYLPETGQYFDLLKDDPMSFKPTKIEHPDTAEGARELFVDKAGQRGEELMDGDTLFAGLSLMYEAHWNRQYRVEFYYRNASGRYTGVECERNSWGNDYNYRLDTRGKGYNPGTRLEYYYKITAPNGDVMYYGSEASPLSLRMVDEYSMFEPGA